MLYFRNETQLLQMISFKNYMKALLTATYVCIIIRVLFLVLKILSHLNIIQIKTLILMNKKSEKVHGFKIVLEYYENLKLKEFMRLQNVERRITYP